MSSSTHGISASEPEVTHVSGNGLWLLAGGREYFLSFEDFPWFKDASIGNISNVEQASEGHFYWPELDVDLGIDSIEHPEKFPLKGK